MQNYLWVGECKASQGRMAMGGEREQIKGNEKGKIGNLEQIMDLWIYQLFGVNFISGL